MDFNDKGYHLIEVGTGSRGYDWLRRSVILISLLIGFTNWFREGCFIINQITEIKWWGQTWILPAWMFYVGWIPVFFGGMIFIITAIQAPNIFERAQWNKAMDAAVGGLGIGLALGFLASQSSPGCLDLISDIDDRWVVYGGLGMGLVAGALVAYGGISYYIRYILNFAFGVSVGVGPSCAFLAFVIFWIALWAFLPIAGKKRGHFEEIL